MTPDFSCPYGLACRVATIANGLSHFPAIKTRWIINEHCPTSWNKVFPHGIPGVEFVETAEIFPTTITSPGIFAHQMEAAADREKANSDFALVMASMAGGSASTPPSIAILGRFHTNPGAKPYPLADIAINMADKYDEPRVFLLSDCYRFEIAQRLSHAGIAVVLPLCQPLPVDLVRTEKDILNYMSDWKTMLAARHIIALNGWASALHPALAAGTSIHRPDPFQQNGVGPVDFLRPAKHFEYAKAELP